MKEPGVKSKLMLEQLQLVQRAGSHLSGNERVENAQVQANLISRIGSESDWPTIVYLTPSLVSPTKVVSDAAADAVEQILARIRPTSLLYVDERLRAGMWSVPNYLEQWDRLSPADFKSGPFAKTRFGLCAMATFHRSGYVREEAVREIAKYKDGREFPFLLIRMCDWVPGISNFAAKEIDKRIESKYLRIFADNLALLDRLSARNRFYAFGQRQALLRRIKEFLAQESCRKYLFDGLGHPDIEVRRSCVNLACSISDIDPEALSDILLKDLDLNTRRKLFKLADILQHDKKIELLEKLSRDKAGVIRRDSLRALCDLLPEQAHDLTRQALLDESMAVREYARWKLSKIDAQFNVVEFYRDHVQNTTEAKLLVSAVCGLGESGKTYDAALLTPFLESGKAPIQRAAIRALANLDASSYLGAFVKFLAEENGGLSRAAMKALEPVVHQLDPVELWQVVNAASQWNVKRRALSLLNGVEKWERVVYMLQALAINDAQVQDYAANCLVGWQGHYGYTARYTLPSKGQQMRIEAALERAGPKVSGSMRKLLRTCLEECRSGK